VIEMADFVKSLNIMGMAVAVLEYLNNIEEGDENWKWISDNIHIFMKSPSIESIAEFLKLADDAGLRILPTDEEWSELKEVI